MIIRVSVRAVSRALSGLLLVGAFILSGCGSDVQVIPTPIPPSDLVVSPSSTQVDNGQSILFQATAGPQFTALSYQWSVDGVDQAGATNPSFSFSRIILNQTSFAVAVAVQAMPTDGGAQTQLSAAVAITVVPASVPASAGHVAWRSHVSGQQVDALTPLTLQGQASSPSTLADLNASTMDIAIEIDTSNAVTGTAFTIEKNFASSFVNQFTLGGPRGFRIGVGTFSGDSSRTALGLSANSAVVQNTIGSLLQAPGGITSGSLLGMSAADAILTGTNSRPSVSKLMLVMTQDVNPPDAIYADVFRARSDPSWYVIAMSVDGQVPLAELESIATTPSLAFNSASMVGVMAAIAGILVPATLSLDHVDVEILDATGTTSLTNVSTDDLGQFSITYQVPQAGTNALITAHVYGTDASYRAERLWLLGNP